MKRYHKSSIDGECEEVMERIAIPVILVGIVIFIGVSIKDVFFKNKKNNWKIVLTSLFVLYCSIVGHLTLGYIYIPPFENLSMRIQLEPFYFIQEWKTFEDYYSWAFFNNARLTFFNFLMLMPLGFFLVYLFEIKRTGKAFLLIFGMSLLIEITQLVLSYFGLVWMRGFNTDDLIMNSLGGILIFITCKRMKWRKIKREK